MKNSPFWPSSLRFNIVYAMLRLNGFLHVLSIATSQVDLITIALVRNKSVSWPISRVLSWTIIHLDNASPHTSSDLPGCSAGTHLLHPYLILLRTGFTLPHAVTSGAVRSYRTLSPLPS